MSARTVTVSQTIKVTIGDGELTPEFMAEFRESFYDFDTPEEHFEHLAQLFARGVIEGTDDEFIEGYGVAKEMGIKFFRSGLETEVEPRP
jgi:5-formaminoimidazole-4-carboxamide-1-beta-D-ribofuranosyl 5'-monophosphate synthetase